MNSHKHARVTAKGRALLVRTVHTDGWTVTAASTAGLRKPWSANLPRHDRQRLRIRVQSDTRRLDERTSGIGCAGAGSPRRCQ